MGGAVFTGMEHGADGRPVGHDRPPDHVATGHAPRRGYARPCVPSCPPCAGKPEHWHERGGARRDGVYPVSRSSEQQ